MHYEFLKLADGERRAKVIDDFAAPVSIFLRRNAPLEAKGFHQTGSDSKVVQVGFSPVPNTQAYLFPNVQPSPELAP